MESDFIHVNTHQGPVLVSRKLMAVGAEEPGRQFQNSSFCTQNMQQPHAFPQPAVQPAICSSATGHANSSGVYPAPISEDFEPWKKVSDHDVAGANVYGSEHSGNQYSGDKAATDTLPFQEDHKCYLSSGIDRHVLSYIHDNEFNSGDLDSAKAKAWSGIPKDDNLLLNCWSGQANLHPIDNEHTAVEQSITCSRQVSFTEQPDILMEAYEHGSHVDGIDTPIPEAGTTGNDSIVSSNEWHHDENRLRHRPDTHTKNWTNECSGDVILPQSSTAGLSRHQTVYGIHKDSKEQRRMSRIRGCLVQLEHREMVKTKMQLIAAKDSLFESNVHNLSE